MRLLSLVAAAGASSRFGQPKALLRWDDQHTFLSRIVGVLDAALAAPIVITHPAPADMSHGFVAELSRVMGPGHIERALNGWPDLGLSGSVRTALEQFGTEPDALVVWPVDCPFADAGLVQDLVRALGRTAAAAVPVADGQRGHPVVFARAAFELLAASGERGGPRAALAALAGDVVEVPWSDARVTVDVDTREDYRSLFGREP